jgi:hypothetical protein
MAIPGYIAQLQGEVAFEAGVHEPGGGVDQQAQSPQPGLALEPGHDVGGEADPLHGGTEHELAGVEDEGPAAVGGDLGGELRLGLARIDERVAVAGEDPEAVIDPDVQGRGLQHGGVEGVDRDAALLEGAADGAVREDHGAMVGRPFPRPRGPEGTAGRGNRVLSLCALWARLPRSHGEGRSGRRESNPHFRLGKPVFCH